MRNLIFSVLSMVFLLSLTACSKESEKDFYPYPEGKVIMDRLPLLSEHIASFIGLGQMDILPKDHGGFFLVSEADIPLFAPIDGQIIGIIQNPDHPLGNDVSIFMKVSTTITLGFGHLSRLHPDILEQVGDLNEGYAVNNVVRIPVKAGQLIAYGGLPHGVIDFFLTDLETQNSFIREGFYPDVHRYAGHYPDYFRGAAQDSFLAKTPKQLAPRGGKHDYDMPGKMIGNWFLPNTADFSQFGRQFAIAYHYIESDQIQISDGYPRITGEGLHDYFFVKGNAPKPEDIGVTDGLVKYELLDGRLASIDNFWGTLLLQLTANDRLKIEYFQGRQASEVNGFGANAREYER